MPAIFSHSILNPLRPLSSYFSFTFTRPQHSPTNSLTALCSLCTSNNIPFVFPIIFPSYFLWYLLLSARLRIDMNCHHGSRQDLNWNFDWDWDWKHSMESIKEDDNDHRLSHVSLIAKRETAIDWDDARWRIFTVLTLTYHVLYLCNNAATFARNTNLMILLLIGSSSQKFKAFGEEKLWPTDGHNKYSRTPGGKLKLLSRGINVMFNTL